MSRRSGYRFSDKDMRHSKKESMAKRTPALDRIDVKILAARQRSGRMSIEKLSAAAGLSARACLERVRRLEAARIIMGYQAVIDIAHLSKPITAFAEIYPEKAAHQATLEQRFNTIEEIVECWEVSGTVDYLARFVCADLAAYEELTSALIDDETLGVARIVSHVALRPTRRFTAFPPPLPRLSRQAPRAHPAKALITRRFRRAEAAPPGNPPRRPSTSAAQAAAP